MRQHFLECLECDVITAFPSTCIAALSTPCDKFTFNPLFESTRLSAAVADDRPKSNHDASLRVGQATVNAAYNSEALGDDGLKLRLKVNSKN